MLIASFNPQDFFTLGSFGTLAGATGIVYIVCGTIQQAFNSSPKWLALAISLLVACLGAYLSIQALKDLEAPTSEQKQLLQNQWMVYLLGLLNGCLIYMTATGTNKLLASGNLQPLPPGPGPKESLHPKRRTFRTDWWRP